MAVPDELLPPYVPIFLREVVDFYDNVKTQWRVAGTGAGIIFIGLDYTAVKQTADILNFELDSFRFAVLKEIEQFMQGLLNGK